MKILNIQFWKNNWPKILSVFLFVLLAGAYVNIFAIFYTPGQTLNPGCAPGAGCGVSFSSTDLSDTANLARFDTINSFTKSVNLRSGTATAGTAPLKFTSGTNLGTTEAGAIEYDGVHLYFTATNGGSRYQLDQQASGSSPITIVNTSNLFSTGLVGTGSGVTTAEDSIFLGVDAGNSAIDASSSNFIGIRAGASATTAYNSNFLGQDAGYGASGANNSNFLGDSAGYGATDSYNSNFLGISAGDSAINANDSNFFGASAGASATNASLSNFFGYQAGNGATDADYSNFLGASAGTGASDAHNSNFLGTNAGNGAINAFRSNFLGYYAGSSSANAANSIFIGQEAGINDTVDNSINGLSSILIGSFTNTDGHTNSIILGSGTSGSPILNTKDNQFMLAPSVTEMRLRGIDYSLPSSQGGASTVLTNDGSGGLTWTAVSGSGISLTTTGSSGAATLVGSVLNVPQYTAGTGLSSDADFNTKGGTSAGLNLVSGAQANTFLGYEAGKGGAGATNMIDNNVGIGYRSLYLNTDGVGNTSIGNQSLYSNTTGSQNVANGYFSLNLNTSGSSNTANGAYALSANTTGQYNIAIGFGSLYSITTGSNNSSLGSFAGRYITNGITANTTSMNSLYLGYDTRAQADNDTNEIVIGASAIGNGSDTATIGNSSLLRTYLTGINLKAGSATAGTAPLKFTAGNLLGTTEAGAIEYNGSHLYFTAVDSGARYQLDQQAPGSLSITTTGSSGPATLVGSVLNVPQYTSGTGLSSDGFYNTKGGTNAGLNFVGSGIQYNTFLGYEAGKGGIVVSGASLNIAIGYQSLYSNTSGTENTAIGADALYTNTSGSGNTSIGKLSMQINTSGSYNTAIGLGSLNFNKANNRSTSIGYNSMYYADNRASGIDTHNTAVGYESLRGSTIAANNTGYQNTAIGDSALLGNTSGNQNVAIGYQSLLANTTGGLNTANGIFSLGSNTTGTYNTAFGGNSLGFSTTGSYNTANGSNSMTGSNTGSYNTASGYLSLKSNTSGYNNTGIGSSSLENNSIGYNNTAIGFESGKFILGGVTQNTSSTNSLYIGSNTKANTSGSDNEIIIGYNVTGNGSNTTTIGTGNVLYVGGSTIGANSKVARFTNNSGYCDISPVTGGITCSSDITLKKNITTLDGKEFSLQTIPTPVVSQTTLEKIMEITPVNYNWNPEKDTDPKHIGFIAQEMEQIFPSIVSTDEKTGLKSISYASITPYLVKGIQEMNLKMGDLQDITTKDPNKITLGSLIKSFLADIGNGIEKIFVKEIDTKNLCVSDVNDSNLKTCLTKVQLDELLAKAGGVSNGTNNSNIQQNNPPVLTIDEQLMKAKIDVEALIDGNYTEESWAIFINAKDTATSLPETNDDEKIVKITALNDSVKILVAKIVEIIPVDMSAYNEALAKVIEVDYTPESFSIYKAIVDANVVTDANTQAEVDTATENINGAQINLEKIII